MFHANISERNASAVPSGLKNTLGRGPGLPLLDNGQSMYSRDAAVLPMWTGVVGSSWKLFYSVSLHVKWLLYHHGMARPQVAIGGDGLQLWAVAANILNKQLRTADKEWPSGLGVGLTAYRKNRFVTKYYKWPRTCRALVNKVTNFRVQ
jgi:hypothetical protein